MPQNRSYSRCYAAATVMLLLAVNVPAASAVEATDRPAPREVGVRLRLPPRASVRPAAPFDQRKAQLLVAPPARQARPRDSLKNGILIGAIAGGAYGALVSAFLHDELGSDGVAGVLITTTATGAGIGFLIDRLR